MIIRIAVTLEALKGEKCWVKSAGGTLQDSLRFFLKIQRVDSFCRKHFARGCVVFFERVKRNTHNLNSVGTTPVPVYSHIL